ncbi:hypothetical protein GC088_15025 [Arthrobacter sp. JZ12]|nr:hypothetical protein GC088_15025 [Arthrobacter sp. JZ12]
MPPSSAAPVSPPEPAPSKVPAPQPSNPALIAVTDAAGDSLLLVDPGDAEEPVVGSITVGQAPWDVYATEGMAFVSTAEGVAVVDVGKQRRTALIPYLNAPQRLAYGEYRPGGTGIVASADGTTAYVAVLRTDGTSVLERIDVTAGRVTGSVEVGLRPFDILMSPDGSEVYTVDHDSFSVHVVDTETLKARRIEVAPFGTEGGLASWEKPHYAALDSRGRLLLPFQGLVLAVVDPSSGAVAVEEMIANSHEHGAALADGRLLVVGTGPFGSATGQPNLTLRDLGTGAERVLPLDRLHENALAWTDPASGRDYALLSGGYTRDGYWSGITVVDLQTLELREIEVPGRPQALAAVGHPFD